MNFLYSIGLWLDEHLVVYWAVSLIFHLAIAALCSQSLRDRVRPSVGPKIDSPLLFLSLLVFLLAWYRFPWVMVNREINADESDWIVQAMTYSHDPVPWRSTHGGTSGPLTAYAVTAFHALGSPLNYTTTHTIAAVLSGLVITFLFSAFRLTFGDATARWSILPTATFLIHAHDHNFVHLASEYMPLMLSTLATFCFAIAFRAAKRQPAFLLLAGASLSCIAFAKLQAVPLGVAVGLSGLVLTFTATTTPRQRLWWSAALLTGVAIPPFLFLIAMVWGGSFADFLDLYIYANFFYGRNETTAPEQRNALQLFFQLVSATPEMLSYAWQSIIIGALGFTAVITNPRNRRNVVAHFVGVTALVSLAAAGLGMVKPGHAFPHYSLLLLPPLAWLHAVAIAATLRRLPAAAKSDGATCRDTPRSSIVCPPGCIALKAGALVLLIVLAVPPITAFSRELRNPEPHGVLRRVSKIPQCPTARLLKAHASGNDSLAVWGWRQDIYVESGLRPALREAETRTCFMPCVEQALSRQRLIEDLTKNKPEWFVDAVAPVGHVASPLFLKLWGPAASTRRLAGYETFPDLRQLIETNYVLFRKMRDPRRQNTRPRHEEGIRVYRRLDRISRSSDEE